jgi:hypothetical protein
VFDRLRLRRGKKLSEQTNLFSGASGANHLGKWPWWPVGNFERETAIQGFRDRQFLGEDQVNKRTSSLNDHFQLTPPSHFHSASILSHLHRADMSARDRMAAAQQQQQQAPASAAAESASPIGIANLPNQRHKIVAKRGAAFTIMVGSSRRLHGLTLIKL